MDAEFRLVDVQLRSTFVDSSPGDVRLTVFRVTRNQEVMSCHMLPKRRIGKQILLAHPVAAIRVVRGATFPPP